MAKPSKPKQTGDESTLATTNGMLTHGLQRLDEYIRTPAESNLEEESAQSLAHLLTKVAQVAAELRKAEAFDLKAAGEISPKAIIDYARRQSPADQKQLARQILDIAVDAGRSGLA